MSIIVRIIGGGALIAAGVHMVVKTDKYLSFFGRIAWAEQHLGLEGGSRLFYKLFGLGAALIGIAVITGLGGAIFMGTVGQLLFLNNVPR